MDGDVDMGVGVHDGSDTDSPGRHTLARGSSLLPRLLPPSTPGTPPRRTSSVDVFMNPAEVIDEFYDH